MSQEKAPDDVRGLGEDNGVSGKPIIPSPAGPYNSEVERRLARVRRLNRIKDTSDDQLDLMRSVRPIISDSARAILLANVTATFKCGLINRRTRRDLRILLGAR